LPALLVGAVLPFALTACGGPDVTKARLDKALVAGFDNAYAARSAILGESVSPAQVAAKVDCDRGGPTVEDVGPGADWLCTLSYTDDKGAQQASRLELQVRANSTYVAGGPSRLVGPVMLTDALTGKQVVNPAFEFDGAFDPNG
jgi:hypothetical protein